MPTPKGLTFDTPAVYRIGVQGFLDKSWSDRMNGVDIRVRNRPDGSAGDCAHRPLHRSGGAGRRTQHPL